MSSEEIRGRGFVNLGSAGWFHLLTPLNVQYQVQVQPLAGAVTFRNRVWVIKSVHDIEKMVVASQEENDRWLDPWSYNVASILKNATSGNGTLLWGAREVFNTPNVYLRAGVSVRVGKAVAERTAHLGVRSDRWTENFLGEKIVVTYHAGQIVAARG